VQTEYSLFSRQVESNGVLATARDLGIGFVASSPLGRGFLTGTIQSVEQLLETDLRRGFPRFEEAALGKNLGLLEEIRPTAAEHHASLGQVALAWLLGAGKDIVAIPGTRTSAHLEENIAASRLPLSAESRRDLAQLVSPDAVIGDRRSPAETAIQD
jgi:aryl-alcohol dehydrogenase-like predicted oxidoreductase